MNSAAYEDPWDMITASSMITQKDIMISIMCAVAGLRNY